MAEKTEEFKNGKRVKSNKDKKKKILFIAIRISVSAGLFAYFIVANLSSFKSLPALLNRPGIIFLFMAVLSYSLSIFIAALRWDTLLRSRNEFISKRFLLMSYYIGFFYSNILPTNIGGDIYRTYDVYKNKEVKLEKSIAVIVVERFISYCTGAFFIIVSFFAVYRYLSPLLIVLLGFILLAALLLILIVLKPELFKIDRLFKRSRVLKRFEKRFYLFYDEVHTFRKAKRSITIAVLLSLLGNLAAFTSYFLIGLYLEMGLDFISILFLNPIIVLSGNIPVSIGGIGIRENIAVILLKGFNIAEGRAAIFALLALFIILLNALIGGMTYIFKNIFYKSNNVV